jgi:16S rRNA (guanine527-N7)-methyltransferase
MNTSDLKNLLNQGIVDLGLNITSATQTKLFDYLLLLQKWNKTHNLTAITDLKQMITHHLLDSLAIAPFIESEEYILDVGSGAGLPGIPLALIFPEKTFVLLDSNNKKVTFLTYVVAALKLANVKIEHSRAENFHPAINFDCIVTRAVGSLHAIITITQHLIKESGSLLFMKGKNPLQELEEIDSTMMVKVYPIHIPNLNKERHLICITKLKL